MKIQYMSDLHLEFPQNQEYVEDTGMPVTGDILLLAGDITYLQGSFSGFAALFLREVSRRYRQVLLVPGNHEYYAGGDIRKDGDSWELLPYPNVGYYHNRVVRIDDTDFILSTLWSRISEAGERAVWGSLNDFRRIECDGVLLRPKEYNEEHDRCLRFIREAVVQSDAPHVVVVTHHAPSLHTVAPEHLTSPMRTAFATDLDTFIADSRIDYWVYGHSHTNIDCQVGQTKIVCNQLGYVSHHEDMQGFDYNKYFEI